MRSSAVDEHTAAAHWHVDPRWTLRTDGRGRLRGRRTPTAARRGFSTTPARSFLAHGDEASGLGWYAPAYGVVVPAWTARITRTADARSRCSRGSAPRRPTRAAPRRSSGCRRSAKPARGVRRSPEDRRTHVGIRGVPEFHRLAPWVRVRYRRLPDRRARPSRHRGRRDPDAARSDRRHAGADPARRGHQRLSERRSPTCISRSTTACSICRRRSRRTCGSRAVRRTASSRST